MQKVITDTTTKQAIDGASDGLLNKHQITVKLGISKRSCDAWMKAKRLPVRQAGQKR